MAPRIDPRLGGFARSMRTLPTPIERKLWSRLRASQLGGFKFRRQAVIAPYIVDFFCPSVGLIVELDGSTHQAAPDAKRDAFMRAQGFEVLRFTNQTIGLDIESVLAAIHGAAVARPARWAEREPVPHPPTPSPEGEGEL